MEQQHYKRLANDGKPPRVIEIVLNPVEVQLTLSIVPVEVGEAAPTVGMAPIKLCLMPSLPSPVDKKSSGCILFRDIKIHQHQAPSSFVFTFLVFPSRSRRNINQYLF
ncbi:MAG: hypothetical protein Q7K65_02675 [Candidatus Buchananbacteria bacterium]|nr:hypothetical protein [Candidatus Buchananbacteria bacterium]